jgi:hypothetical protein
MQGAHVISPFTVKYAKRCRIPPSKPTGQTETTELATPGIGVGAEWLACQSFAQRRPSMRHEVGVGIG